MKTTLLAFGIVKEIFNDSQIGLELQDGITVKELRTTLETTYPGIKKIHSFLTILMSPKLPIGMSGLDACVVGFSGEGCYQIVTKYGHTASDQSYK